jgi:hypothetical protein
MIGKIDFDSFVCDAHIGLRTRWLNPGELESSPHELSAIPSTCLLDLLLSIDSEGWTSVAASFGASSGSIADLPQY